jgi:hypothetical protein
MNKKQAAMLVTETIQQINAADQDAKDVDDDDASGEPEEQNAGDQMAGRRKKKTKRD